jgi:calcium-binding protein CML
VHFPPGTDPEIIRSFELGDIDGSGAIDAVELGRVLSTGLPFSMRTVNLMLHLFSTHGANKIGPTEFVALWIALKEWKVCFEKFDRDRSGRIDFNELRDALLSMGYAISPPLLDILISKYDRTGQAQAMDYDNFVECGFVVKGLTDRFKAKDLRYTGSATIDYESFMKMVLPFVVA